MRAAELTSVMAAAQQEEQQQQQQHEQEAAAAGLAQGGDGGWCRTPVNSSGTGVIRVLQTAAQGATPPGQPSPPPPIRLFRRHRGGARK